VSERDGRGEEEEERWSGEEEASSTAASYPRGRQDRKFLLSLPLAPFSLALLFSLGG
jgi:hypothetical protein